MVSYLRGGNTTDHLRSLAKNGLAQSGRSYVWAAVIALFVSAQSPEGSCLFHGLRL